jgi:hypothetical protein
MTVSGQLAVKATRIKTPPKIDGLLNEDIWKTIKPITNFIQREPETNQPVSEPTEVYIAYDENFIYIGMHCYGDPKGITAKEMARDVSLGDDDRVQVIFDTFLDKRNGYWFQIGPRGSIGDAIVSENGGTLNKDWDGLWEGKAKIHDKGWDAELAIPFKTLSFKKGQTSWGMKIIRNIKRKQEASYWPVANVNTYRFQISDAGLLEGLDNITQGIGLDASPYGLLGLNTKKGDHPKYKADGGLDLFYQVTPGIKSALTINTDFAQTEVDNRQINLTRFSLLFPEKRDFFLDGANYFHFGIEGDDANPYSQHIMTFFSRRLGLDSLGSPIPINWGTKVTGQAGKFNIGMQYINDERSSSGNDFAVARFSYNLGQQSSVGIIGTYGNAVSKGENFTTGFDTHLATSKFLGNKNLSLTMFGIKSNTINLKGKDLSYGAALSYPNDLISFLAGFHEIRDNYVAGIGFVPRAGIRESYGNLMFGPRPGKWGILQVFSGAGIDYITDVHNKLLTQSISIKPIDIRFSSGDEVILSSTSQYEFLNKSFTMYSVYTIPTGTYRFWQHSIDLISARRRIFWSSFHYGSGNFYDGNRRDVSGAFGYKVAVPLYIGLEATQSRVALPEGSFTAEIYRTNINFLFSPDITLYNFAQYDNFSKTMGWQSRFQWIIKPGKEIMLVWNSIAADPFERFTITESSLNFKIKYLYRF